MKWLEFEPSISSEKMENLRERILELEMDCTVLEQDLLFLIADMWAHIPMDTIKAMKTERATRLLTYMSAYWNATKQGKKQ